MHFTRIQIKTNDDFYDYDQVDFYDLSETGVLTVVAGEEEIRFSSQYWHAFVVNPKRFGWSPYRMGHSYSEYDDQA
ncbi:hypothetical protein AU197_21170 [Mycobacterium sp. IS-1590]|uniref:hypothetical protein n=1 Tax=Mycobacterium sp. IS-1590 TaxID=1772286 RepID=UPI00074993D2|nr:hypothetical protein [Mycobacterium sp. IS-1590]KUI43918.1 hypothetical protein AU197_21170 [Mycobacterium sp. IS-1590]